jgi:Tol biopolymer transport system component
MRIITFVVALILIMSVSGCAERGPFSTTAPTTRGVPTVDPLPRLIDNLPGENHFANIIQLTDGGNNRQPSWSPTGQYLVFSSIRPPHSSSERYIMAIDGSGLIQITGEGAEDLQEQQRWASQVQGWEGTLAVSPDGSRVCFHGYRDENQRDAGVKQYFGSVPASGEDPDRLDVYISNSDGSGVVEVVSNGAINCGPCFSPDGKHLVFSSNLGGEGFDLYSVTLDGKMMEKVTTSPGFDGDPTFSPDGRRLVFISQRNDDDTQEFNIFVADWLFQEQ